MDNVIVDLLNLGIGGMMAAAVLWLLYHTHTVTLPKLLDRFAEQLREERAVCEKRHAECMQGHARVLDEVKRKEAEGFAFEGADASFYVLVKRILGEAPEFFQIERFSVNVERRYNAVGELIAVSEAIVKVKVGDEVTAVDGKAVKTAEEFQAALGEKKSGDKVKLALARGGDKVEVEVRKLKLLLESLI